MTLAVAQLDGDSIAIVSDTKVTYRDDATRTRRTFENAVPKIVLLTPMLAVALAGNIDDRLLATVTSLRGQSTAQVLNALHAIAAVTFLVADIEEMRLWSVGDAHLEERTQLRRAWAGSPAAYEVFIRKEAEWPPDSPVPFRLTTSMQFLTSFDVVEDVGGYTLTAVGHRSHGYAFVPMPQTTFPAMFDGFKFDASEVVQLHQLAGTGDTFGALGLWLANTHRGLLFTHEQPWAPISIDAPSVEAFVESAEASHGQLLTPS